MQKSTKIGLGRFVVVGVALSVSAGAQTACGARHRDPGAYICSPKQSQALTTSFHLSAYGNAPTNQKITGYQVAIDGQLAYQEREPNPVRELSIETTIKGPASQGPHTLRLTVTGAGSAEVSDLRVAAARNEIAPCDPLSKSPNWVCLAAAPHSESKSPFDIRRASAEGEDLRSIFLPYRDAYQRSWKNLEFGTAEAFALDRAGNIYVASHSFADITVRKYDPQGSRLLYSGLVRACGEGFTAISALVVNDSGEVWVSGYTDACLPTTADAYQKQITTGTKHGFVARLKTDSNGPPEFLTYIGGPGEDQVNQIRLNADGEIYLAGVTNSKRFPHNQSFSLNARSDTAKRNLSFVALLNPTGSTLTWSALLHGGAANALAMDRTGAFYITGQSSGHAFVAKLSPDGSRLIYTRAFAGSGVDHGSAISVDQESGRIYVTGETTSTDFPAIGKSAATSSTVSHRSARAAKFLLELTPEGKLIQSANIKDSDIGLEAIDAAALDAFVAGRPAGTKSAQK